MSRTKDLEYFCDGIAEEITNVLSHRRDLKVVARTSAFQFKGSIPDVRTVGRTLDVRTILEGSVRTDGEKLRVTTQLVDATDGYRLWGERFDRTLDDVFTVQDEIAEAVANSLQLRATDRDAAFDPGERDVQAYDLLLKGKHYWNKRTEADLRRSGDCYLAALERDPSYAQAYAALAQAYVTLGLYGADMPKEVMPKARSAAERAVDIGGRSSVTLATLGCIDATHGWSWQRAEQNFLDAIALNPGYPVAHQWYGINCLVPLGRFDDAAAELRQALDYDPLSPVICASAGANSYFARRYDAALEEFEEADQRDASLALTAYFLGLTLTEMGRYNQALEKLTQAKRLSGGSPEMVAAGGYASARAGDADGARSALGELVAMSAERYVSSSLFAQIHAGLRNTTTALDWLEKGLEERAVELAFLAVRPVFDELRHEPRFGAVRDALGLSPTS